MIVYLSIGSTDILNRLKWMQNNLPQPTQRHNRPTCHNLSSPQQPVNPTCYNFFLKITLQVSLTRSTFLNPSLLNPLYPFGHNSDLFMHTDPHPFLRVTGVLNHVHTPTYSVLCSRYILSIRLGGQRIV